MRRKNDGSVIGLCKHVAECHQFMHQLGVVVLNDMRENVDHDEIWFVRVGCTLN